MLCPFPEQAGRWLGLSGSTSPVGWKEAKRNRRGRVHAALASVGLSSAPWSAGRLLSPCLGLMCLLSLSGLCLIQAKLSEIQETRAVR